MADKNDNNIPNEGRDRAGRDEATSGDEVLRDDIVERDVSELTPHELGVLGELLASTYLEELGYEILEHNYRCSEGEADLIAYDHAADEVVLIEVKSRRARPGEPLFPEEAVDARRRKRYRRIAACYLMDRFPVLAVRFDVIAITFSSGHLADLEHLYNAFDWEAER